MVKVAETQANVEGRGEERRWNLSNAAEHAAETGADTVREGAERAEFAGRTAIGRSADAAREAAARTTVAGERAAHDMGDLGSAVADLFAGQTQEALRTTMALSSATNWMTLSSATNWFEVARVQGAFVSGSFERVGKFADRYHAIMRSMLHTASFTSRG